MMSKQMQTDKQFAAMVTQAQDEDRKKLLLRRQSRTPPTDHIELVEFFLNTQADDMEVRDGNICSALTSLAGWGACCLAYPVRVTTLLLAAVDCCRSECLPVQSEPTLPANLKYQSGAAVPAFQMCPAPLLSEVAESSMSGMVRQQVSM
jgi:hypothetical protein